MTAQDEADDLTLSTLNVVFLILFEAVSNTNGNCNW